MLVFLSTTRILETLNDIRQSDFFGTRSPYLSLNPLISFPLLSIAMNFQLDEGLSASANTAKVYLPSILMCFSYGVNSSSSLCFSNALPRAFANALSSASSSSSKSSAIFATLAVDTYPRTSLDFLLEDWNASDESILSLSSEEDFLLFLFFLDDFLEEPEDNSSSLSSDPRR